VVYIACSYWFGLCLGEDNVKKHAQQSGKKKNHSPAVLISSGQWEDVWPLKYASWRFAMAVGVKREAGVIQTYATSLLRGSMDPSSGKTRAYKGTTGQE